MIRIRYHAWPSKRSSKWSSKRPSKQSTRSKRLNLNKTLHVEMVAAKKAKSAKESVHWRFPNFPGPKIGTPMEIKDEVSFSVSR